MKKLSVFLIALMLSILTACGSSESTNQNAEKNVKKEESVDLKEETITFGMTGWTSTEAPTQIAKLILEEAGYDVKLTTMDQPLIFAGLKKQDIDFFMDAWLPYTEATLWGKYENDLQKVATSYENVPLGWVVPSYVDINSIEELKNTDALNNEIVTISPGAGIVSLSKEALSTYELDNYDLMTSSEAAMLAELKTAIDKEEPIVITGWRPHSMFAKFDLKFLEDPKESFKPDNVYVISYKGIEENHPEAYEILSKWSIEVADLEDMMLDYEEESIPFEESAQQWIEEHRDQVDEMLGK